MDITNKDTLEAIQEAATLEILSEKHATPIMIALVRLREDAINLLAAVAAYRDFQERRQRQPRGGYNDEQDTKRS